MSEAETVKLLRGRVTRVSSEPRPARRGDYLFRGLELSTEDDDGRVFLIAPETLIAFKRVDLYRFPLLCWEGSEIAAHNLHVNNRLEDGSVIYMVTPESFLVLEPYRPVSVTDAVEAAACVRSVDTRYRSPLDEPFWTGKGKMFHTLFDAALTETDTADDDMFERAYRRARPAFLEVLPGSAVTYVDDESLIEEAWTHFSNMTAWLRRNRSRLGSPETEVDRISTLWGLKGRADAFCSSPEGAGILELKTGRVPVEDHRLQLSAYSMLFEDYSSGALDCVLFYSGVGREQRVDNHRKALVIDGRNRVIALRRGYLDDPETAGADARSRACSRKGRCFSKPACARIFGDDSSGVPALLQGPEKDYYDSWFRLLSIEAWDAEGDFARTLNPVTLSERLEDGTTLPVSILAHETAHDPLPVPEDSCAGVACAVDAVADNNRPQTVNGRFDLRLRTASEHYAADLTPGDEALIHRGDPCAADAYRGRIMSVEGDIVSVRVNGGRRTESDATEGRLDRVPFSRGWDIARQALFRFLAEGDKGVIRAVVRNEWSGNTAEPAEEIPDLCFSEGLTAELNEDQEAAVTAALAGDPFHLVHGPPGTGKTRVLARLIRACLDRGERILLACPTNTALDRILVALIDLGVRDFLRVGSRSVASAEFLAALDRLGNPPLLLRDLAARDLSVRDFRNRVNDTRLIAATAYQCSAHAIFIKQRFDRVVVDEAGQLDEPMTLAPLALARKFVLGGDHLQLPPITRSRDGDSTAAPGLSRSLFERLFKEAPRDRVSGLRVQYRMNRAIQDIPSRLFYEGRLIPSPEVERRTLNGCRTGGSDPVINGLLDPARPVVFADVAGDAAGRARPEEAEIAFRLVDQLIRRGIPAHEIGVITPYRAQQSLIRKRLAEAGGDRIATSVDTVDRFQGGEREVIILSLARSDGVTSFLADRNRLNVSLSRARSKLILLGSAATLEEHPLFASVLEGLERIVVGS